MKSEMGHPVAAQQVLFVNGIFSLTCKAKMVVEFPV